MSEGQGAPVPGASHDIGWAVQQMRAGARVRRVGWNGKGMFLFLVRGSRFEVNRPPLLGIYAHGTAIDYQAHVDMKTADGTIVPWLCSMSDLLAIDWENDHPAPLEAPSMMKVSEDLRTDSEAAP